MTRNKVHENQPQATVFQEFLSLTVFPISELFSKTVLIIDSDVVNYTTEYTFIRSNFDLDVSTSAWFIVIYVRQFNEISNSLLAQPFSITIILLSAFFLFLYSLSHSATLSSASLCLVSDIFLFIPVSFSSLNFIQFKWRPFFMKSVNRLTLLLTPMFLNGAFDIRATLLSQHDTGSLAQFLHVSARSPAVE